MLVHDFVAIDLEMNVGDQVVAHFHAAVFHRHERSLLLAQIQHRLVEMLVLYLDLRLLDRKTRQRRQLKVRLDLDLK